MPIIFKENKFPLHKAIEENDLAEMSRLIDVKKIDVNALRGDETPLHLAVANNLPAAVDKLLSAHANAKQQNTALWTPMHLAALSDYDEIAKIFMHYHQDSLRWRGHDGKTPFLIASESHALNVFRYLITVLDPSLENAKLIRSVMTNTDKETVLDLLENKLNEWEDKPELPEDIDIPALKSAIHAKKDRLHAKERINYT